MNQNTINTLLLLGLGAGITYFIFRPKRAQVTQGEDQPSGGGGGGGGFAPEGYIVPTAVLGAERSDTITIQQQQQQAPSTGAEAKEYWQSQIPAPITSTTAMPVSRTDGGGTSTGTGTASRTSGTTTTAPKFSAPTIQKAPAVQPAKRFSGFLNMDAEVVDMEENM